MTEEEILIRAREAAIAEWSFHGIHSELTRNGAYDGKGDFRIAIRALRDLSKPLSEIQPVDPDLIEAREIVGARYLELLPLYRAGRYDSGSTIPIALAAIKRGRELERGA
jgi:hypothetical protein